MPVRLGPGYAAVGTGTLQSEMLALSTKDYRIWRSRQSHLPVEISLEAGLLEDAKSEGFDSARLRSAVQNFISGGAGARNCRDWHCGLSTMPNCLIVSATVSPYVAVVAPKARSTHLIAATIFWLIAALIWMVKVIPKVAIPDSEE